MTEINEFSPSWVKAGAAAKQYANMIDLVSSGDEDAMRLWNGGLGIRLLTELVAAERSRALGAYKGEVEGYLNSILLLLKEADRRS